MTARKWLKVWGTCERVLPCDRVTKYVDVYMCVCVCTCMPWGNMWVCLLCVWMYMCLLSGSMFMCTSISVPPLKSCRPETWAKVERALTNKWSVLWKNRKLQPQPVASAPHHGQQESLVLRKNQVYYDYHSGDQSPQRKKGQTSSTHCLQTLVFLLVRTIKPWNSTLVVMFD